VDQVINVELLGRHGEVILRHAARSLPVRIGRAYDNDLILEDPYVAAHHVVVERSPTGELEIVDAGSRNGLFRAGSRDRLVRERVDPAARYRAGKTRFRVRSSVHPVADELIEHDTRGLRELAAALLAVLVAAAALLFDAWSSTSERTEVAKLALVPGATLLGLFVWSGAWGLAGRVLAGELRFAAHLTTAALALLGVFLVAQADYLGFAFSAPGLYYLALCALVAVLATGLWRHLSLVIRDPGRGTALAAVAVAAVCVGSLKLVFHVIDAEDVSRMAYMKAIKPPAVRLVEGSETGQFFQDAGKLKGELEGLKGK